MRGGAGRHSAPDRVFVNPDGHGGAVAALERDQTFELWEREGVRTVVTFQVDNPLLAVVDPDFIGRLLTGDALADGHADLGPQLRLDTERTDLPLVGPPFPPWEREPLRWLAESAVRRLGNSLDSAELRGSATPRLREALFHAVVKK